MFLSRRVRARRALCVQVDLRGKIGRRIRTCQVLRPRRTIGICRLGTLLEKGDLDATLGIEVEDFRTGVGLQKGEVARIDSRTAEGTRIGEREGSQTEARIVHHLKLQGHGSPGRLIHQLNLQRNGSLGRLIRRPRPLIPTLHLEEKSQL